MTLLNEAQQRAVVTGFTEIYRQLRDIEALAAEAGKASTFCLHVNDVSPIEARVVSDYFARARLTMDDYLHEQDIPLKVHRTSLRHALQMALAFVSVEAAEFRAQQLRSYGPLDEEARREVDRLQDDLHRWIDRSATYLRQGLGRDLSQRLIRLEASPANKASLVQIERVINRWQLLEFHPLIEVLVTRWETLTFEIAVFGRVSCGKSSLLNRLVSTDVLPVGVTPVTSVPTRLVKADTQGAIILFAESDRLAIPVSRLAEFVTEQGNPNNRRHVAEVMVCLSSARLQKGLVLVDTPGIGSLARAASADTFAYLPRCDLGLVLIDASSTLTDEDLTVLRLLCEIGTPTQVLLSKADLIGPAEWDRVIDYTRKKLKRELGVELDVHPVSTAGDHVALTDRWFEDQVEPLCAEHRTLAVKSPARKTAHLRESVIAVLQTLAARHRGADVLAATPDETTSERQLLREAESAIDEAHERCDGLLAGEDGLVAGVLGQAAESIVAATAEGLQHRDHFLVETLQRLLIERSHSALSIAHDLQESLARLLEMMERIAPVAALAPDAVRQLAFQGLPAPDASSWQSKLRYDPPALSPLPRRLAVWSTRWALQERFRDTVREFVQLYDRQVHSWLRTVLERIVTAYEPYGELFREQVQRLHADDDGQGIDMARLEADLHLLERDHETATAETPSV